MHLSEAKHRCGQQSSLLPPQMRQRQGVHHPYNASPLRAWGTNMDIQMVGSCSVWCSPVHLQLHVQGRTAAADCCWEQHPVPKIGHTLISLHLCGSTHSLVFVNTARLEKHTKILRPTCVPWPARTWMCFKLGYMNAKPGEPFNDVSLAVWYATPGLHWWLSCPATLQTPEHGHNLRCK